MKRIHLVYAAVALLVACGTAQKKQLIEASANAASDEQRRSAFEATARVLDENPEYVDEFYAVLRAHPKSMSRMFARTVEDLDQKPIAKTQAQLLVAHPAALELVFSETLESAKDKPKARAAISKVIEAKAGIVADIQTDRAATTTAAMNATIAALEQKPSAQPAFHAAMKQSAPKVTALLAKDGSTLATLTEEMLKVSAKDKAGLKKLLEKVGVD